MPDSIVDDPRLIAPRGVRRTELPDGAFLLESPEQLGPCAKRIGDWLERWAVETPHAPAFAEPDGTGGWRTLTWAELRASVGRVGQALLDLRLPDDRPIVVLSDNGLEHLVLSLAAMHVGRITATVSSAYSRLANGDFARIHRILEALDPALVYASDASVYGPVLVDCGIDAPAVFGTNADTHAGALDFATLAATTETAAVRDAFDRIGPDTVAKYLLTSGSTGHPKVVINTHRMLCANQQMLGQTLRFLDLEKPVLLDWLPWSHTFGGNHNVNLVLRSGGTLYIDDGRPMPGLVDRTIAHLRDVQPTIYFNVPRGYEILLPALQADRELAAYFFGRLRMLFYSGAGMPASTWRRLVAVAASVRDEPLWLTTSWGATETAPAITFVNWHIDGPGVIGLPMPGVRVKFVPNGNKLEMRVAGDHVFPGYRNDAEATRAAFDDDGFYRIGDAGYLADDADPLRGIVFDGRVAEDFKLASGTWVSVGTLRLRAISALAPHVQDVVVTGHDRDEIGLLVFVAASGRALDAAALRTHVRRGLATLAADGGGSSRTPARALLLSDAPSIADGEITDKGYLNQRVLLSRRAAEVDLLHGSTPDDRVIVP